MERLDSWKEIAAYLKRDVRTIQRWESFFGLPIHRVSTGKRSPVFAYRSELDEWWKSQDESLGDRQLSPPAKWTLVRKWWSAGVLAIVVAAFLGLWHRSNVHGPIPLPAWSLAKAVPGCDPPPGLLAGWQAEGNADDALGRNNATPRGGTRFAPGIRGQAFLLDGENGDVLTPVRVLPAEFTASAWIELLSLTHPPGQNLHGAPVGDMSILDKMADEPGPNFAGWRLLKQHDNLLWFCVGGRDANRCGAPPTTVFSRVQVAAQAWYHVAIVKTSNTFALYVNGELEDTRPLPAPGQSIDSDVPLRIGGSEREGAHFNGLIDEVLVFSRSLSATEIRRMYEAGASGVCGATRVVDATVAQPNATAPHESVVGHER